jgi:H+/gluconate symporter-like permease
MVNSSSDISVFLDDQAIDFTLTQNDTYYTIDITYTHSTHELMTGFVHSSGTPAPGTPAPAIPLELIVGAVAAIAAIFAIAMVARGRKKGKDGKKATEKDSRNDDKPSENERKKQPSTKRPAVQRRLKTEKGN